MVFERLSPEKVSTLKVIDDPSRINDEAPAFNGDISDVEIVEEEVEVDLAEAEANALNENNVSFNHVIVNSLDLFEIYYKLNLFN